MPLYLTALEELGRFGPDWKGKWASVDLSRRIDGVTKWPKEWNPDDMVFTLRTNNDVTLISLGQGKQNALVRKIRHSERLVLAGSSSKEFEGETQTNCNRWSGCAYPAPVVTSIAFTLIKAQRSAGLEPLSEVDGTTRLNTTPTPPAMQKFGNSRLVDVCHSMYHTEATPMPPALPRVILSKSLKFSTRVFIEGGLSSSSGLRNDGLVKTEPGEFIAAKRKAYEMAGMCETEREADVESVEEILMISSSSSDEDSNIQAAQDTCSQATELDGDCDSEETCSQKDKQEFMQAPPPPNRFAFRFQNIWEQASMLAQVAQMIGKCKCID